MMADAFAWHAALITTLAGTAAAGPASPQQAGTVAEQSCAGAEHAATDALDVTTSPAVVQVRPADDEVQRALEQRLEEAGIVGIVAGVTTGLTNGASRTWAAGARAQGAEPVDAHTVFEIGSVSKALTGVLLAEMVVRGEVALDDPVSKYLPAEVRLQPRGREITLLDLATHTSGLPRLPLNLVPADMRNPYKGYDARQLHEFLASYQPQREPGDAFEYSNLGAGLLGHVLALRAGASYEALVTERILEPLGMHDTRLGITADMAARLASGHGADGGAVPNWDMAVLAAAGGWVSTADDMLRFVAAAVRPPAGPLGEAFRMAMTPRRETGQDGLRIGLGWHVLERDGHSIVWHNGQTGGYHAFIGVHTHRGTGSVVLANAATPIDDVGVQLLQRD